MTRRPMATPRSRAWAPEPRRSRLRPVLEALLLFGICLAAGVDSIRF